MDVDWGRRGRLAWTGLGPSQGLMGTRYCVFTRLHWPMVLGPRGGGKRARPLAYRETGSHDRLPQRSVAPAGDP
ncbi:hypothetical protein HJFPF1_12705 [Paramyrothecium foliicola]|nr:hypothetical protein HJFPF1_12705 [Paramyrothecium foliicola]